MVRGFFQPFEDHNPGQTSEGLNFFFNDELEIGLGKFAWNADFAEQFRQRKGYDLMEVLPAMWEDIGDITPKVRIDYADVRMSLMEERYFQPVYEWHASRGIIFGCDNHGRGLDPHAYGDYFRACRWYSAPGHDTPGGSADPIKGKVSSSIANLYQRPRVWLEGYHSLGWGATPEQMMFATRENYLYGCTLLSLHGFYYTMAGSHWEWAPPCYHFRMPYWEHMGTFLKYFERLSYIMSQGHQVCDVAVIYPVTPYEAEMNGDQARDAAFDIGRKLLNAGINFDFIDHESIERAEVVDGRLIVRDANASYRVLVFPAMDAVRWKVLEKASDFARESGIVLLIGEPPLASDRAGRNDPQLVEMNAITFKPEFRSADAADALGKVQNAFVHDVRGLTQPVRALHRKVGDRDVYLVMDAKPGAVVEFRAQGKAELWDPWTGEVRSLRVVKETVTGAQVQLPLEEYEAQVVVFSPGEKHKNPDDGEMVWSVVKTLPVQNWQVAFEPTMDNRRGDFRLPVTARNETIGVEARRFAWVRETPDLAGIAMLPETDDSEWGSQLHGYGPQFYLLGPISETLDPARLDAELAGIKHIDPTVPVQCGDEFLHWQPYEFSWRYGKEGDPGHQGYHGLKGVISDHFIRLGKAESGNCGVAVLMPDTHKRYYLWTSATIGGPTNATIHVSSGHPADMPNTSPVVAPSAVFVNGQPVRDLEGQVSLGAGANPVLLRFDDYGEAYFVLRRKGVPMPAQREKLAMRWSNDAGVIPFDPYAGEQKAEWFRFLSATGTTAISLHAQCDGPVQAWCNGTPMADLGDGRFGVPVPMKGATVIALRLIPHTGQSGGAAIPEPVVVETDGKGSMPPGDWSAMGILRNYSGGVRYRTTFTISDDEATRPTELDLGRVIATAEVHLNGEKVGVRVAPPWRFDLSGFLQAGENTLEVLVFNTLANHYQTIPSLYRGDPASGLFGPVEFRSPCC